jgi:hypothetical protein
MLGLGLVSCRKPLRRNDWEFLQRPKPSFGALTDPLALTAEAL